MSIVSAIAFAASAAAPGLGLADLDRLDREVAAFTGASIGAPGGPVRPLDRRMRLQACQNGVSISWHTPRRETVSLRCSDPGGWSLFVPVLVSGPAGQVASMAGAIAVNRGDAVSLSVSGRGFAVSRPAEALEGGAVGAWIRVRPVTDRQFAEAVLRAQVVRPGAVKLPGNRGELKLLSSLPFCLSENPYREGKMPSFDIGPTRAVGAINTRPARETRGQTASPAAVPDAPVAATPVSAGKPPVDVERVAQIRKAVEDGSYPIVPARVADAMIAAGILLRIAK